MAEVAGVWPSIFRCAAAVRFSTWPPRSCAWRSAGLNASTRLGVPGDGAAERRAERGERLGDFLVGGTNEAAKRRVLIVDALALRCCSSVAASLKTNVRLLSSSFIESGAMAVKPASTDCRSDRARRRTRADGFGAGGPRHEERGDEEAEVGR